MDYGVTTPLEENKLHLEFDRKSSQKEVTSWRSTFLFIDNSPNYTKPMQSLQYWRESYSWSVEYAVHTLELLKYVQCVYERKEYPPQAVAGW